MTGHLGQDITVTRGQLRVDSQGRPTGTGKLVLDSWGRTVWIGKMEQYSRTRQPGHDRAEKDRA
jgi:hypothetical protein